MASDYGKNIAEEHRRSLVGIGWQCGPLELQGGEWGFTIEARTGMPKQRRSFDDHGTMTVTRMERTMDAVDLARQARCTYCTKRVTIHARQFADHRAQMGMCAGSGRRIAEFDHHGHAIFEAQTFGASDANGRPLSEGDRIRENVSGGDTGRVIEVGDGLISVAWDRSMQSPPFGVAGSKVVKI